MEMKALFSPVWPLLTRSRVNAVVVSNLSREKGARVDKVASVGTMLMGD